MSRNLAKYLNRSLSSILRKAHYAQFKLIFRNIGNACFTEENSGPFGRKPNAEAMAVIIADAPMKPFAVIQYYGNLCVGINQGFQVFGFGSGLLQMCKILDLWRSVETLLRMSSFEMASFEKSHRNLFKKA
jgi:hypothetical protein